jgi:acylphosphatase
MIDDHQHYKVHAALNNMRDGEVLIYLAGTSQLLVVQEDELVLMQVLAGTLVRQPAPRQTSANDWMSEDNVRKLREPDKG